MTSPCECGYKRRGKDHCEGEHHKRTNLGKVARLELIEKWRGIKTNVGDGRRV
jgi:hypothetical protein